MNKSLSNEYKYIFAKRLKVLMIVNDTSNTELGEYLSMSKAAISNYLSCAHSPSLEVVCKIADYFNVSIDFLLGRSGAIVFDMNYIANNND